MNVEREITEPVDLCDHRGRLSDAARGWSRRPMLRANLTRAHGRKKRWDYWAVITDELVVSFVYADIDYAGLSNVWVMEHATGHQTTAGVLQPLGRGFELPEHVCTGSVSIDRAEFSLHIDESLSGTRLRAWAPSGTGELQGPIDIDIMVTKPEGHESLNVVVPWSARRFQFTSKQNSRPAVGTVRVGDRTWTIDESHDAWGVQDLGRGVWKYANRWNWAAASGHAVDGRVVGLQFGAKWTEGTGATENALCIDGRVTKISDELEFTYSWDDPMAPWTIGSTSDDRVDLTLTPTFDRYDVTDLKMLKMEVHQCFGRWTGRVVGDDGVPVEVRGIRGFAEEARNRW